MDAARDLLQMFVHFHQVGDSAVDALARRPLCRGLQRPQLQAEGDDPLLRSVMQIAFETSARLIRRGDDARA